MTITIEPVIKFAAGPTSPRPIGTSRLDGRAGVASWPATCRDLDAVVELVTNPPFVLASPGSQKQRRRGVAMLLDWLAGYPGQAWQERWLASGVDTAGGHWRDIPARWLHGQGRPCANATLDALCAALPVIIGADVVRPSIDWFIRAVPRGGALARTMAQTRDIEGFARLQKACDEDAHLPATAAGHTRHRAAILLGANGGGIAEITVDDIIDLLDVEADAHRRPMAHAVAFYRTLYRMGVLGPDAPATLQQVRSGGPLSCEQLIDRYQLACQPVRDLLVDYLRERQPALDYSSLRSLAATLGNVFWKDLGRNHPGINSLRLAPEVAQGWKRRLRTRQARTADAAGAKHVVTERLLVVSPELADVLSAIIQRVRNGIRTVPVIPAYDRTECVWLDPAPWLFQRRLGTEHRRICPGAIRNMLTAALAETGLTDPATGGPLHFTPHDFRRIFITDAIMSGLPPHIAQIIAGHRDINVTMGYKAVYPDETIQAHRAFLARRRALRPSEEYRTPTDEEWTEFLGHFERRKVATGTCGRAFATPCIHEHACIRCPMLWPDPSQRARLQELRENLTDRISEAEREGWTGEVEGLKISLAGANDKLAQLDRRQTSTTTVDLDIPTRSR